MTLNPIFMAEPKEPDEITPISLDYKPRLTLVGDSLASFSVTIKDRATLVDVTTWMLVTGTLTISDGVAVFLVQNGSDNRDYTAELMGETVQGLSIPGDIVIPVRERR